MRKSLLAGAVAFLICVSASFSFAAPDPAVTLVNPSENEPIVTNNFLISVKVTQVGKILNVSAYELQKKTDDGWVIAQTDELEEYDKKDDDEKRLLPIMETESFESKGVVSFFTYKVEDIAPGVYMIRIDTVDADGAVLFGKEYRILVKEQTEEESKVFETPKSGTSQFIQNLLNKLFKN
ncbi:MAG: hypothetical protein LBP30_04150 [Clostridiales Family XIII bacterium]|jgi:hypothetical protein|nr:hypothetical protein [Clostridiales Family XIII bacterium]